MRVDVNQIYTLVNDVFAQTTGRTDIKAVDTGSLVAMGNELENLGKMDIWLNACARRIGKTIDDNRVYRNKFADLYRDDVEWGAMVQKFRVEMPEAKEDDMAKVGQMDGQSLDHYIISNPVVKQKIFDKETPYSFFITIQDAYLKEAFLNAGAMNGLLSSIFTKVQNKIEIVLEDLARTAVNNFMLNCVDGQIYHLLTMYNNRTGKKLTATQAWYDEAFLRFAIGIMNTVSDKMETMSTVYNAEGVQRFTPKGMQRCYLLSDFKTNLETQVQYAAFHEKLVDKNADVAVPYWQAVKEGDNINDLATVSKIVGTDKTMNNVLGVMFDKEAIGTHRQQNRVYTTPINARGAYYNTFWHENQMWFNDMGENGIVFMLD